MVKSRRARGDGGVYRFTDANGHTYWKAVLELPRIGGKRQRKAVTAKTRTAAVRRLGELRRLHEAGVSLTTNKITFGQYLTQWLNGRDGLADSSRERYAQAIARIPDNVQGVSLTKLHPTDLERCYTQLRAAGMAPAGIRKVHMVIHAALDRAVQREMVIRNVADLVDAPRVPKVEVQTIGLDDVLALLDAAKGDRFEALYTIAATTGMRQGELLALRWQDIDWNAPAVMVRGSARAGVRYQQTKTTRHRRISLTPTAVEALRAHRIRQAEERLKSGPQWKEQDLIFPSEAGTVIPNTNFYRISWKPVSARAGMPDVKFKDATRHAAGTLLMLAGIPTRIVSDILGHAQASTTQNIYEHVLPGMQAGAVEAMERLLHRETGRNGSVGAT